MFETLKTLVSKLEEGTTAKSVRGNRLVLQAIKVEAQKCRVKLITDLKNAPKVKRVKKVSVPKQEDVYPAEAVIEEPKLVKEDDDDFFDNQ